MPPSHQLPDAPTPRGARSIQRIIEAAARLFGREGFQGASMHAVARAAGVSKGLLHYHFRSKEHLLLEAVRATFRRLHVRFTDRFRQGERGMPTALEGLDALWRSILDLRALAPFMVETLSLAIQSRPLRADIDAFLAESTDLLEQGVRDVFTDDVHRLAVPPERLAQMVRVGLHGLVVELALARDEHDLARIEQTYRDLRDTFARVALVQAQEDIS